MKIAIKSISKPVKQQAMTLLELLIILGFLVMILFIAFPTLRSPKITDVEQYAKDQLKYLYERERAYYLRNGYYDRFSELAKPENGGPFLDKRFLNRDEIVDRGIKIVGPSEKSDNLLITATLPGNLGTLSVDHTGRIKLTKPKDGGQGAPAEPLRIPDIELPSPEKIPTSPEKVERT